MNDYAVQARVLSLRLLASTVAAGEAISSALQRVGETQEKIRQSDQLIASISKVYPGFGTGRFSSEI